MTDKHLNFTSLLDDYLKDPLFAADFLSEALAEEDFDVFLLSLKDVLRIHGNLSAIAKKAHLNRGTLYRLFAEDANPEMKTILAILDSLGYGLKVTKKERSRVHMRRKSKRPVRLRKKSRRLSHR